ncbi:MAG: S8 family serine peptidase [Corynebacterium sp.]|nr:S8 family serine peptidase [Corynebacterium sp.]
MLAGVLCAQGLESNVAQASTHTFTNPNDADSKAYYGQTLREMLGVTDESATGKGVKIGVISDSFGKCAGVAQSFNEGALPAVVHVLEDSAEECGAGATDEGRAMLELIYQIAPEAELYFAAAGNHNERGALAVRRLANEGVDVIVDDIFSGNEPAFHYSPWSRAIEEAKAQGIMYFSAVGNAAMYDRAGTPIGAVTGQYVPGECPEWVELYFGETCMQFGDQGYSSFTLADVRRGGYATWQPYFATSVLHDQRANYYNQDQAVFEIYYFLKDANGHYTQIAVQTSDANESGVISTFNDQVPAQESTIYYVIVQRREGAAPAYHFKHIASLGRELSGQEFSADELRAMGIDTATTFGHSADGSAIGVGAVVADGRANNIRADYSAIGRNCIYYDGTWPAQYQEKCVDAPRVYGITGGVTRNYPSWTNTAGLHIFDGTSAAAPTVAAVAALLKQKNPGWHLDPTDLSALQNIAVHNPSTIKETAALGMRVDYAAALANISGTPATPAEPTEPAEPTAPATPAPSAISPLLRTTDGRYTTDGTTPAGTIDLATGTLHPVANFQYAYDADFTQPVDPAALVPGNTIYVRYHDPAQDPALYGAAMHLTLPGRHDTPTVDVAWLAPGYDHSQISLRLGDGTTHDVTVDIRSDDGTVLTRTLRPGADLRLTLPNEHTYIISATVPGDAVAFASLTSTQELRLPARTTPPTALPAEETPAVETPAETPAETPSETPAGPPGEETSSAQHP